MEYDEELRTRSSHRPAAGRATGASPCDDWADLERDIEGRGRVRAAVYDRVVRASLVRVWENVFDWEHLPWLHSQSFSAVQVIERGPWGWKVRAQLGRELERWTTIELRADRSRLRYVSATLDGPGAGTEIWTRLEPVGGSETQIHVEFWIPATDPARLERVGRALVETYTTLWDQDEAMMRERTRVLAHTSERESAQREVGGVWLDLGPAQELRSRVPFDFELEHEPYRLFAHAGGWRAYSLRCPHMFGPLQADPACPELLRCPWHGYAFDMRTAASVDGHRLALAHALVEVDPRTDHVRVRRAVRRRRFSPD